MPPAPRTPDLLSPAVVSRLGPLDLIARIVVEGFIAGRHRSRQHGSSIEFTQHREYTPGDETRHVDWRVWGRTDRLHVKQYAEETNTRIQLLLDTSASMACGPAEPTKLRYGACLAAALAWLATRQRDPIGLALAGDHLRRFVPARTGPAHLQRILSELEMVAGAGPTDFPASLAAVTGRLRRRGLVVIISDLLDDPIRVVEAIAPLRRHKHEVLVLQVLTADERRFPYRGPAVFHDPETGRQIAGTGNRLRPGYLRELDRMLGEYRSRFYSQSIEYHLLETTTPFDDALVTILARRARGQRLPVHSPHM
ncbi:DUF58 domain-containing protein [bacterium]|nr:DUF58 domain-containing protein [bacterium]